MKEIEKLQLAFFSEKEAAAYKSISTGLNKARQGLGNFMSKRPLTSLGTGIGAGGLGGAYGYRAKARNQISNMNIQQRLLAALAALFNPQALAQRF